MPDFWEMTTVTNSSLTFYWQFPFFLPAFLHPEPIRQYEGKETQNLVSVVEMQLIPKTILMAFLIFQIFCIKCSRHKVTRPLFHSFIFIPFNCQYVKLTNFPSSFLHPKKEKLINTNDYKQVLYQFL